MSVLLFISKYLSPCLFQTIFHLIFAKVQINFDIMVENSKILFTFAQNIEYLTRITL